jgi:hypothetical protein
MTEVDLFDAVSLSCTKSRQLVEHSKLERSTRFGYRPSSVGLAVPAAWRGPCGRSKPGRPDGVSQFQPKS